MDDHTLGMIGILVAAVGTMIGVMSFLQLQTKAQIADLKKYLELKIGDQERFFSNDIKHLALDVKDIRDTIKVLWKHAATSPVVEAVQEELAGKDAEKGED